MVRWIADLFKDRSQPDEIAVVEAADQVLNAAIDQAKATLDVFWTKFDAGEADRFQLKAGLTTPNGAIEHVWLTVSGRQDGRIVGRLGNQPVDLVDLNIGDEVQVDLNRVSDWAYIKEGRLYGAFTQRAMLDRADPRTRRQIEAVLSPNPLETDA